MKKRKKMNKETIGGITMYEELTKRLRNCTSDTVEDCAGGPYQGGYKGTYCMNGLVAEAADVIEELSYKYKKALGDLVKQAEPPKEK